MCLHGSYSLHHHPRLGAEFLEFHLPHPMSHTWGPPSSRSYVWPSAPTTHIVICGEVTLAGLDSKGNEADGSSHPHETLQASRQLPGELYIFWGAPWWPQRIGPIPQQQLSRQARRQALGTESRGEVRREIDHAALGQPLVLGLCSCPRLHVAPSGPLHLSIPTPPPTHCLLWLIFGAPHVPKSSLFSPCPAHLGGAGLVFLFQLSH